MGLDPPDALLSLAEDDQRLLNALESSHEATDSQFGFFCQQAIEKAIKSVLSRHRIAYPRTHNLGTLIDLLAQSGIEVPTDLHGCEELTPFAAQLRYPYDAEQDESVQPLDRAAARGLVSVAIDWASSFRQE